MRISALRNVKKTVKAGTKGHCERWKQIFCRETNYFLFFSDYYPWFLQVCPAKICSLNPPCTHGIFNAMTRSSLKIQRAYNLCLIYNINWQQFYHSVTTRKDIIKLVTYFVCSLSSVSRSQTQGWEHKSEIHFAIYRQILCPHPIISSLLPRGKKAGAGQWWQCLTNEIQENFIWKDMDSQQQWTQVSL